MLASGGQNLRTGLCRAKFQISVSIRKVNDYYNLNVFIKKVGADRRVIAQR